MDKNKQLDTIRDLEVIKTNWLEALDRLYEKENEYQQLITDIKEIRNRLSSLLPRES